MTDGRMTDRDGLLAAIRSRRSEFESAGDRAEDLRTLPPDAVETLREMGAFWLKTPADLGGTPLSPLDFCDVIEELAYADSSTAWAAMIGAGDRIIVFVLPRDEAEVIDNWQVAGLVGTGSMDFRVEGQFVPDEMTYELGAAAVRGGDLFRLGMPAFVSNEVPPLCIGMARRALDDITELAGRTTRWPGGPALSERAVFLKELGRAEVKISAARLAHRDAVQVAWATAQEGNVPSAAQQLALTIASVYAVETCADVVSDLFRYGGGRVLSLSSPMQRHLRNALAARQHVAVSEEFYEAAGRLRIESAVKS